MMTCSRVVTLFLVLGAVLAAARNDFDKAVTEVAENAEKAAAVYAEEAKKFPSTQELMDDMDRRNEMDDRATQNEMISETEAALAAAKPACSACETDYSTLCPSGWEEKSSGACIAPGEYTRCEAMGFFGQYSVEDKQAFERRCGVCWPCYNAPAFVASKGRNQVGDDFPLDLPTEIYSDVNKPPYPVINIVADPQPFGTYSAASALVQQRRAEQARRAKVAKNQVEEDHAFEQLLEKQTAHLERLTALQQHRSGSLAKRPASFLALRARAKIIGDEVPNAYPVVNVAADEPAAANLADAEEGLVEEQMLAKLEDKVLKLKETVLNILTAENLSLEKLSEMA